MLFPLAKIHCYLGTNISKESLNFTSLFSCSFQCLLGICLSFTALRPSLINLQHKVTFGFFVKYGKKLKTNLLYKNLVLTSIQN